jgi:hypothetical protein
MEGRTCPGSLRDVAASLGSGSNEEHVEEQDLNAKLPGGEAAREVTVDELVALSYMATRTTAGILRAVPMVGSLVEADVVAIGIGRSLPCWAQPRVWA